MGVPALGVWLDTQLVNRLQLLQRTPQLALGAGDGGGGGDGDGGGGGGSCSTLFSFKCTVKGRSECATCEAIPLWLVCERAAPFLCRPAAAAAGLMAGGMGGGEPNVSLMWLW